MQATEWLKALDFGKVEHEWATIVVEVDGRVAEFRVSADAVKVDGVRQIATARTAQLVADAMGALLLTAKLYELRWKAAAVHIPPSPGNVVSDRAEDHSKRVDTLIFAAGGVGRWQIVADVGKAWVIDARCTPTVAINHGWITPPGETGWSSGRPYWHGIPVTSCVALPGEYLIQRRGGAHGLGHVDYSQVVLLVHERCKVDGVEMVTADVYTSAELADLVIHDGKPLQFSRQPGVERLLDTGELDKIAVTQPAPPKVFESWKDASTPLGLRCLSWSLLQMKVGVKEEPPGSNNGPQIREWLRDCVREGQPGFGDYLARTGGNWCAAFYCAADKACRRDDESAVHKYRASGIELERDAAALGAWHPVVQVYSGEWTPEPGDGVIFQRGNPRVPSDAWKRHVARFVEWIDPGRTFTTIGGNERDTIRLTEQRVSDPLLRGFIENVRQWIDGDTLRWAAELDRKLAEGVSGMDEFEELLARLDDLEDGDDAVG